MRMSLRLRSCGLQERSPRPVDAERQTLPPRFPRRRPHRRRRSRTPGASVKVPSGSPQTS